MVRWPFPETSGEGAPRGGAPTADAFGFGGSGVGTATAGVLSDSSFFSIGTLTDIFAAFSPTVTTCEKPS